MVAPMVQEQLKHQQAVLAQREAQFFTEVFLEELETLQMDKILLAAVAVARLERDSLEETELPMVRAEQVIFQI